MCRKRLSSPRCRSELIDPAWVVIVSGLKCIKKEPQSTKAPVDTVGIDMIALIDGSGIVLD